MHPFPLTVLGALGAAASLPSGADPAVAEDGKALFVATDTAITRVLFRSLDHHAPILWISPNTLGTKLSVAPGHHHIEVVCEFKSSGRTLITTGNAEVDVEVGHVYDVAALLNPSGQKCDVTVTSRS